MRGRRGMHDRQDAVGSLAAQTELAIGFKQVTSVWRPAAGVTPWHDHGVTPHIGQHDSTGGRFGPGLGGVLAAGAMSAMGPGGYDGYGFANGFGEWGGYWAFRALGATLGGGPGGGFGGSGARPMVARANVSRGRLIPATEDLSALAVTGDSPTVLAFVLAQGPGGVAYEVLNRPEPVTYVFGGELAAVNRALSVRRLLRTHFCSLCGSPAVSGATSASNAVRIAGSFFRPGAAPRRSSRHRLEYRFGLLHIGGVPPLGEPAVDWRQQGIGRRV